MRDVIPCLNIKCQSSIMEGNHSFKKGKESRDLGRGVKIGGGDGFE